MYFTGPTFTSVDKYCDWGHLRFFAALYVFLHNVFYSSTPSLQIILEILVYKFEHSVFPYVKKWQIIIIKVGVSISFGFDFTFTLPQTCHNDMKWRKGWLCLKHSKGGSLEIRRSQLFFFFKIAYRPHDYANTEKTL